jgi:protein-L-isoaspartate(D-aspartate) O-methyltransferase
VPRHEFVPDDVRSWAYEDTALPIGSGQTISQPYIVALMSELLACGRGERILEIGTGSGYQAAVLAEMGCEVFSVEILRELGERAAATLARLGYVARTRIGDGYAGWPEEAPFDGVIVTAAPEQVPSALIEQLAPEGRMVIPVGPTGGVQELLLLRKQADGSLAEREIIPVRFVPMVRRR